MMPIEPGCLAMIHGLTRDTHLNGKAVRVIDLHPMATTWLKEPWWMVDTDDDRDLIAGRCLLRISGDAESEERHAERRRKGVPA